MSKNRNSLSNKPIIIAIVGATASGKTSVAVRVAQIAKEKELFEAEIVSADSRIVYKDFNIGTAKPSEEEMQGIPHHMIGVASPQKSFSAGKFQKEAEEKITEILSRGNLPIIAGGTGFYIKTLLEGLNIPEANPDRDFREKMERFIKEHGKHALYEKLKESDPKIAAKLMPNDSFRIIRALEVQHTSGKKMSEVQSVSESKYNTLYFGLNAQDREFLYIRINSRTLTMIEQGLVEETKSLIEKYGKTLPLLKTLGYKEICDYLDGVCTMDEAVSKIQQNTRRFAKRQLTWFRANKNIKWFFIDTMEIDDIASQIAILSSSV